ncbi:RsmB/NOP family class I SAM-dependent RNA methyltransferase, partial [Pelagibacteraceae bacterium]|nr:RsmB/NOP family class I SAM-dependent RNA methyltransferase [Pelagibacteraceae bacterium]
MRKSVKVRILIFDILNEIHQKNKNFDDSFIYLTQDLKLDERDRSMIYNIVLNSIRNNFFIFTILNNYLKKKTSLKIRILLLSAITQILYLNFKDYAVTNDTVDVAKIKKLNPGLINSLLKNIIKNKNSINKNKFSKSFVPSWFIKALKKNELNLKKVIENITNEPSLHLVFKNKKLLETFKEEHDKTTDLSAFILNKKKIKELHNYEKGYWWVQDLSSMLPIFLSPEIKSKKVLDMCASPGGKSFQTICLDNKVILNDISLKRVKTLRVNLDRLNFNNEIKNYNALDIPEKEKFDVIILDSPCSGVGTLRRNPDILFKKKPLNLEVLTKIQINLINKGAKLLNKNGVLLYMVCSFFYDETKGIKNKFLNDNKNFSQYSFDLGSDIKFKNFVDIDGDIYNIPSKFKNYMVDGFYAVKFIKN